MGRLRNVQPRLAPIKGRLAGREGWGSSRAFDQHRDHTQAWRAWYKTARWQKLRWQILVRDEFTCQICRRIEGKTSQLVCDHIEPHKGNEEKFWAGPFQTLCKACHDGMKARLEHDGRQASSHPEWLRPSLVPLMIVCGPPASGKSTYVREHVSHPDELVIDLDLIVAELSGVHSHNWDRQRWLNPALYKRNAMLGDLSKHQRWPRAWLILSEPWARRRQWWADKLQPEAMVLLATPKALCVERALADGRDMAHACEAIGYWWREYEPRDGDQVVVP